MAKNEVRNPGKEPVKLDYNLPLRAFLSMLDEVDDAIRYSVYPHRSPSEEQNKNINGNYYSYIPMYGSEVDSELFTSLLKNPQGKFLDVGCGSGRILALRKYLTGSEVIGIEIRKEIAEIGNKIYDVKIVIGDAFKIITKTFIREKGIEIIYSYMPISDNILMLKLERHIEDSIPRGYIIERIEMLPIYLPRPTIRGASYYSFSICGR